MKRDGAEKRHFVRLRGNSVEVFGRSVPLPRNRLARIGLGVLFIMGGLLSFLPVLGIWMLPVGLLILSIDFVIVRRWRRRLSVRWERRQRRKSDERMFAAQLTKAPATEVAGPNRRVHHPNR